MTALAAESMRTSDGARIGEINRELAALLATLGKYSWGNRDALGQATPIRHPDELEFLKPADLSVFQGYDVRIVSWGDGLAVPASGSKLIVVGVDGGNLLHIRIFDASGIRVSDWTENPGSNPNSAQTAVVKGQLANLSPTRLLTAAEKARLVTETASIAGQVYLRQRPMTKDAFGQIVLGAYYAYTSNNTSKDVKKAARDLIDHWATYLILHQWRLATNETRTTYDLAGKPFDSLVDGFLLLPHERYAFANVMAKMALAPPVPSSMTTGVTQTLLQTAADFIAGYAGQALDHILKDGFVDPIVYTIILGQPALNLLTLTGAMKISISDGLRAQVVKVFTDAIRESVRSYSLTAGQPEQLVSLALQKVVSALPGGLGANEWRGALTTALQQVAPALIGSNWIEVGWFYTSLQLLKTNTKPDVVGYSVWSYIAEVETTATDRPGVSGLVKAMSDEFYKFVRDSGNGNANGLWAWIGGDPGRVKEYLNTFESGQVPYAYPDYAWQRKTSEFLGWANYSKSGEGPRIDYLVLRALAIKDVPKPLSAPSTWKANLTQAAVNHLKDMFNADLARGIPGLVDFAKDLEAQLGYGTNKVAKSLLSLGTSLPALAQTIVTWRGGGGAALASAFLAVANDSGLGQGYGGGVKALFGAGLLGKDSLSVGKTLVLNAGLGIDVVARGVYDWLGGGGKALGYAFWAVAGTSGAGQGYGGGVKALFGAGLLG